MKKFILSFLILASNFQLLTALHAEDVKITTYYPSPYGSYKQLQVQNGDEDTDITQFTQGLVKAGLSIITDYTDTTYTPGLFWSTQNDNSTKPKAGIWMYEATAGTKLLFDTSNDYITGLHSTPSLTIDQNGNVGIGTASPNSSAVLDLSSNTKGFFPPRMASVPSCGAAQEGLMIYNTANKRIEVCNGTQFIQPSGTTSTTALVTLATADCKLGIKAYRWYVPKCEAGYYIKALTKYTDGNWDGYGCICCAVGTSVGTSYNDVVDACFADLTGTINDYGASGKRGTAKTGSIFGSAGTYLTCPGKDP